VTDGNVQLVRRRDGWSVDGHLSRSGHRRCRRAALRFVRGGCSAARTVQESSDGGSLLRPIRRLARRPKRSAGPRNAGRKARPEPGRRGRSNRATGGARTIGSFVRLFGPLGFDLNIVGLCDEAEESFFSQAISAPNPPMSRQDMERQGFYVCAVDLEDELLRRDQRRSGPLVRAGGRLAPVSRRHCRGALSPARSTDCWTLPGAHAGGAAGTRGTLARTRRDVPSALRQVQFHAALALLASLRWSHRSHDHNPAQDPAWIPAGRPSLRAKPNFEVAR
jgi:hypothetical protein